MCWFCQDQRGRRRGRTTMINGDTPADIRYLPVTTGALGEVQTGQQH